MRKKIVGLLALILALALLCGCELPIPWQSGKQEAVLTVSDAEIGADLYALYLTQIFRTPEKYGLTAVSRDAAEKKAIELCTQYVAINTAFRDAGLRLTPEYKTRIAENVSVKWSFYKKYYEAVGVRKQTLTKFETADAKRELMIAHKYGKGGAAAVSDVELNAYYAVNYVTFRSVNGYLTRTGADGKSERLPDAEIAAIEDTFRRMCDDVRTGSSLEVVVKEYAGSANILSDEAQTVTINRKTSNYPAEFFSRVQQMDEGAPRVIETEDYIFMVVKQSSKDDENLQAHRLSCLLEMCAAPFEKDLAAITAKYKVRKNSSALGDIYGAVESAF